MPIDLARGRCKVIAINNSWRLAPWADFLYACDYEWWAHHYHDVAGFNGTRICAAESGRRPKYDDIEQVTIVRGDDSLRLDTFGEIGWGGNSGFHALNLAVQFGAQRVVLVGYDMHLDAGVHWHGKHTGKLHNPRDGNIKRWRWVMDDAAPLLETIGVEVLNASPTSALRAYRKIDFETLFSGDREAA